MNWFVSYRLFQSFNIPFKNGNVCINILYVTCILCSMYSYFIHACFGFLPITLLILQRDQLLILLLHIYIYIDRTAANSSAFHNCVNVICYTTLHEDLTVKDMSMLTLIRGSIGQATWLQMLKLVCLSGNRGRNAKNCLCVAFITNRFWPVIKVPLFIIHPGPMFLISCSSFIICDNFMVLSPPQKKRYEAIVSCNPQPYGLL